MHYSMYIPDPEDEQVWKNRQILLQENIQKYVEEHKLIPLKCNNFGTNSYFYDKETNTMYAVDNFIGTYKSSSIPIFKVSTEEPILVLNGLV